jgi:hypothetical protein
MDINLGAAGRGIYIMEVRDASGKRLGTERFMVRP